MGYKYIIAGLLIGFCGVVSAQEKLLSKDAAVSLALENNFGSKVAKNQVAIADNNAGILNSGYLPSLTGTAGATYNELNSNTEYPGQFESNGSPRPDLEINDAESQSYNAALRLDYTLFDGMGRLYNFKRLKEQYQLSELQARETIE
ncbi:MAG TPA: transporter, partial [Arenibacter sp.]|nr:transporter [Arenibacter sp.]